MPSSGMSALQSLLGVLWAALAGCVDLPFRESSFTNRTRFSWPCSHLLPSLSPQPEQRGPSQTGARRGDGVAEENPDDRGGAGGDLGADSYVCSNWVTLS